ETVLDNSPYQARVIRDHTVYKESTWDAWCREEIAKPLPGALAFTQFAAAHGIAVIYISNRIKDLDTATLANLRKVGFPVASDDMLLGLGTVVPGCTQKGSGKGCRRKLIAKHYRVLMQFGDALGDFVNISTNSHAGRAAAMAPYLDWIGERWFVLPNPTYGSWEAATFGNDWSLPAATRHARKIQSLHFN
ncbi:MAG: acid phosphatase, partial [Xanthomonadales bacterium]|nr:acid phosphatase [Xanthomonadales bacterium]